MSELNSLSKIWTCPGFSVAATYDQIQAWVQEKYGFHVTPEIVLPANYTARLALPKPVNMTEKN